MSEKKEKVDVLCKYIYARDIAVSFYDVLGRQITIDSFEKGRPIGCVVATGRDQVGFSMLHPDDYHLRPSKAKLRDWAVERSCAGKKLNEPFAIKEDIEEMRERSRRFWK